LTISKPIICFLSILLGYLIGSILPGYFFGRLKHIDIRKEGSRNAGTVNVYKILGLTPAIPTAIYDTLKGVFAIFLAQSMGANFACAQLSGLAAIVGHVLPFYLGFRGGQGVACATGIMLFYLAQYILASTQILYILGFLLIIVAIFSYVAKTGEFVEMIVLPLLCYSLFVHMPANPHNIFLCIIVAYIISIGIYNIKAHKLLQIRDETLKFHWWRVALRPFAIIFVIFYLSHSQRETLVFIGFVALFFILLDLVRFFHRKTEELFKTRIKSFFKKEEYGRFSSMTMFLVAGFITILVFKKDIAIAAFTFLIFGDIFSKIFGLGFGQHKILNKTLEGSLAYLGGALICGYILYTTLHIPVFLLTIGALATAIAELLSLGLDDNLTVALISGAVMTVARIFGL